MEIVVFDKNVTTIERDAFYACSQLTIYFLGTEEDRNKITGRDTVQRTVYFYSETAPAAAGNYWHKVDGAPTKW